MKKQITNKLSIKILTLCALLGTALQSYAQPAAPPATPTVSPGLADFVYNSSGTYSDISGVNYYEWWGGWTSAGDYSIPPVVLGYQGVQYGGIDLNANYNFSAYNYLHIDLYTPNGSSFGVMLVDSAGRNPTVSYTTAGGMITNNGWIHLDIPLNQFLALNPSLDLTTIHQLGLIDNGAGQTPGANYYLDNIYFYTNTVVTPPIITYPTNNAPTPTNAAAQVLALYNSSGIYNDAANINFYPWGSAASAGDYTISGGNTVKSYLGLSYYGVEMNPDYNGGSDINASAYNYLHVDVWTTANQLAIKLVSTDNGAAPELIYPASGGVITSNHWVSLNIPLSAFTALVPSLDLTHLDQLLWIDNGDIPGSGTQLGSFYIDNVYFYSNSVTTPTVINYPTNNAPTPPRPTDSTMAMYNSTGTYTDVPVYDWLATWSGANEITFTNTNTGNVVLKYTSLNYAGVEFPSLDASGFSTLHFDLWTPNANQLGVQLVSLSPTIAPQINISNITSNHWIGIDIPLSEFVATNSALVLNNLQQLLWIDNASAGSGVVLGTYYIDNVYFWNTNQVKSSIALGKQVSWMANSANTYQPQKSANGSTWANLGGVINGAIANSVFDASPVPYYQVEEFTSGAVNGVTNGDFEIADPSYSTGAAGWLAAGSGGAIANPVVVTNLDPHSGSYELDMEGQGTGSAGAGPVALQNNIPVSAGSITLSFYAKGVLMSGGANMQYGIFWYDASNNPLPGGGFSSFPTPLTASYILENVSLTAPAGTDHAQLQFLAAVGAGTSDHWLVRIDDVSLATAGTPATNTLSATVQTAAGITWQSGVGLTYTVQSTPGLASPAWSPLGANRIGVGTNTVPDVLTSSNKFYRVLEDY